MNTVLKSSLIAVASMVVLSNVSAEVSDAVDLGDSAVTKEQVIHLLSPSKPEYSETRSIILPNVRKTNEQRSISMEVLFELDSAELTAQARQKLAPVGEALASDDLATLGFTLEGHTDASGTERHNLNLSQRRAQAVKNFFVEKYAVSAGRIATSGKGETELKLPNDPLNGENRRVIIIAR